MIRRILPLCLLASLSGCYKEKVDQIGKINGVKWSGAYAVPIANIDIGLDDGMEFTSKLLNMGLSGNKVIYIAFAKTLRSIPGNELVILGNQSFNFTQKLTSTEISDLTTNNTVTANRTLSATYAHAMELDSIHFKTGTLAVNFNNSYAHDATVKLTFPGILKNNIPLVINQQVSANSNANIQSDLKGCKLNLTNGGSGYNHFAGELSVTYSNSGGGVNSFDQMSVDVGINNQKFVRVWGYFGAATFINDTDSVSLDIFGEGQKIKTNNISFENPSLKIFYENQTGIPFEITTSNVVATKPSASDIPISGFPVIKSVPKATGTKYYDSTVMNSGNSNIKSAINTQPRYVEFKVKADANPQGKVQRNYVDEGSRLLVRAWVELPFDGWVGSIQTSDTSDLDMDLDGNEKFIDWILFRFHIDNGMPLDASIQGYFADSSGKLLDSVFVPARKFIKGAEVNANGDIVKNGTDMYDVKFERDRISKITTATKLIIKAQLGTSQFNSSPVPVKLFSGQRLKIKMGLHTKLSVNEKF